MHVWSPRKLLTKGRYIRGRFSGICRRYLVGGLVAPVSFERGVWDGHTTDSSFNGTGAAWTKEKGLAMANRTEQGTEPTSMEGALEYD